MAALSSSTFGLAPFFSISLLALGYSSFEVLSYRWGAASLALGAFGFLTGCDFRISRREFRAIFLLSLFRAATSLSLVIAYQNIASGVASIIHFMYPLAVASVMMFFFGERKSAGTLIAILVSLAGAALLVSGELSGAVADTGDASGMASDPVSGGGPAVWERNALLGFASASLSVFAYAGYIIGVRKGNVERVQSTALTCYVMGFGALFFIVGAFLTDGLRWAGSAREWWSILGLALPATAISNIALVKAIKYVGPTLTSLFGALEPLTAVVIGVSVFGEPFTAASAAGVVLIVAAVTAVVLRR